MTSRLSVIVPATNSPIVLPHCLAALGRARRPGDELIVVTDPPFSGPAAARNDGAARATGDVLVFVDADVRVHPDALDRMAAAFAADPELGALFGSYDDAPEAPGVVSRFRNLMHHYNHQRAPREANTFWAGLGAVRRDWFERVGGFDAARYPIPSVEDVDFGMRLKDAGASILVDREVQGTHLKRWTLKTMVLTDLLCRGVPWVALLARRGGTGSPMVTARRQALSAAVVLGGLLSMPTRRPARALGAAAALVGLNMPLYALLRRRLGAAGAAASVGVHVAHEIAAVAAVPAGIMSAIGDGLLGRPLPPERGHQAGHTRSAAADSIREHAAGAADTEDVLTSAPPADEGALVAAEGA